MDASTHRSLLSFLAEIPDPRSRHGRQHSLSAVLGLVCCAIMCGARGYAAIAQWAVDHDIAFMHRLGLTRTPPKLGGIRKVLLALDRTALEGALTRWAETVLGRSLRTDEAPLQACSLDGKTARGSFDGLNKAVHLLSLVAHESRLTVAQAEVPHGSDDKTNEHKTALRLLKRLVLEDRLITGDAMFCQRDLSQQVLDAGGHSLWFVKENQPTLLADIKAAFAPSAEGAFSPSAAAGLAAFVRHGDDSRQGARSSRASDVARHHGPERVSELARRRPGW
jgi:DDE_Tnp_1-associated